MWATLCACLFAVLASCEPGWAASLQTFSGASISAADSILGEDDDLALPPESADPDQPAHADTTFDDPLAMAPPQGARLANPSSSPHVWRASPARPGQHAPALRIDLRGPPKTVPSPSFS